MFARGRIIDPVLLQYSRFFGKNFWEFFLFELGGGEGEGDMHGQGKNYVIFTQHTRG